MGMADGSLDSALRIGQFAIYAIGIGTVLWRLSSLATALQMTGKFQGDRMDKIEDTLEKLSVVLVQQASEKVRLDAMWTQISEMRSEINLLRSGKGFIRERIEGEWPKT
jgi:hypothetical protein